jgi:hypothetical protein
MIGSRPIFHMLMLPPPEIVLFVTCAFDVHVEYPLDYLYHSGMMSIGAGLYTGAILQS